MPQASVSGKVRTLIVIKPSSDFDVERFIRETCAREGVGLVDKDLFKGPVNKIIERLLGSDSGGTGHAMLFEGARLLERPQGPDILLSYASSSVPDPDVTLVFPQFAPRY